MSGTAERYGYGKGIQGRDNSCYLDSTLMALFYGGCLHDETFLRDHGHNLVVNQNPANPSITNLTRKCLNVIITSLRNTTKCGSELIQHLRRVLSALNPKMVGEMMDVEEFVITMCKKGLSLPPFILYDGGSSNYYHQIVLPSPQSGNGLPVGKLQPILETSLQLQTLRIGVLPVSCFLIKMPRANGKLIGYSGIIPPVLLRVPLGTGHKTFALQAVITLRFCHYTCFIRSKKQWIYFDSMAPGGQAEVILLEDMEKQFQILDGKNVNDPNLLVTTDNDSKSRRLLTRLVTDIHFCVYSIFGREDKEFGFKAEAQLKPQVPIPSSRSRPQAASATIRGSATMSRPPLTRSAVNTLSIRQISPSRHPSPPPVRIVSPRPPMSRQLPLHTPLDRDKDTPNMGQKILSMIKEVAAGVKEFASDFVDFFSHDLNNYMIHMEQFDHLSDEQLSRIERLGNHKGIESEESSTFALESVMFALFSNTRSNDNIVRHEIWHNSPDQATRTVAFLLWEVVDALRFPPYLCKLRTFANFRTALANKSPTFRDNIDVDETLSLLFRIIFPTRPFIQYVASGGFVHHLIFPTASLPQNSLFTTSAKLFKRSMDHQRLQITGIPNPQLILKVGKTATGKIIGATYVLPSLTINLGNVHKNQRSINLHLYAIICAKWLEDERRYTYVTYVKWNADQRNATSGKYCWIKMSRRRLLSFVKPWPKLEQMLRITENNGEEMARRVAIRHLDRDNKEFLKLCGTLHLCFYTANHSL